MKPMKNPEIRIFKPVANLLLVALMALLPAACMQEQGNEEGHMTGEDVNKQIEETADTTAAYLTQKQQEVVNQLEARYSDARDKIDNLKDKIEAAGETTKAKLKETIDELEKRQAGIKGKLRKLKESSKDSWDELQEGANDAMDELDKAIDRAKKEFKEE